MPRVSRPCVEQHGGQNEELWAPDSAACDLYPSRRKPLTRAVFAVLVVPRFMLQCECVRTKQRLLPATHKTRRLHRRRAAHARTETPVRTHRSFHISFLSSWIKSRAAKAPTTLPCHTNSFQIPSHIKFMRLQRSHLFNAIR